MQRIERYGVIALVFLLVTIMAVALWGQREQQGFLSFASKGKESQARAQEPNGKVAQPIIEDRRAGARLPMSTRRQETAGAAASWESRVRSSLRNAPPTAYAPPATAGTTQPPPGEARAEVRSLPDRTAAPSPAPAMEELGQVAPGAVEPPPRGRQVLVRRGDTLSHIAQRELGSSKRWREILAVNEGLDPVRMRAGVVLSLPDAPAAPLAAAVAKPRPQSQPSLAGAGAGDARSYVVRKGETLSQIALERLGRASRWKEIVALNPGLDPARLPAGKPIALPAERRAKPVLAQSRPPAVPVSQRELAQVARGRVR